MVSSRNPNGRQVTFRGVAQLVARTAGGREVASSSLVTPTIFLTMKTLKFEPNLVAIIVDGTKTSTWRLHDDKQLEVGDEIQFLDSSTGNTFGYGVVREVISKRFCDLTDDDKKGHETYANDAEMFKTFSRYYGYDITNQEIVKVVKYSFSKHKQHVNVVTNTNIKTEVKLFTDGGSRGNPGPSAAGFVITDMDGNVVTNTGKYLGITTNNQAEYQAVLLGLKKSLDLGARVVHVYMDSLLVVNQMSGIFKIKNRELWPIHQAIKSELGKFDKVTFVHIPREMNKLADAEVNNTLDMQEKSGLDSELL